MIRPAEVVLPVLREALPEVSVVTWMADVQQRTLPMILVRPLGGYRHDRRPKDLTLRVIEMSAHTASDLADTEQLYDRALGALYAAWERQTVVADKGWVHSITETMGPTQLSPLFEDSWRVQGLIRLGLRPAHPVYTIP